jgi:hypothetical protein
VITSRQIGWHQLQVLEASYLPTVDAGWSVAVPSMDVFDSWDSRDYRKEVSFVDSAYADSDLTEWVGYDRFAPNHGSPRPHIAKYWANPGNAREVMVGNLTITIQQ